MNLSTKILVFIGVMVFMILAGILIYKQHELSMQQQAIQSQLAATKQLADGISRAMATYATKDDLNNFATQNNINLKAIQDDLSKLNASLTAINQTTVDSSGQSANNVPSTDTTPNPTPTPVVGNDPYGYDKNRQVLHLDEDFTNPNDNTTLKVPVGDVGFSAWQQKPWDINIQPREYSATTVLGTDENQKTYAYNKFTIKVGDKSYPVKISSNTFMEEYPTAKFSFWNPRLFLGVDGAVNINSVHGEATPNLSLGIMSYGKYKSQPDLSILQVGVGYGIDSQKPQVVITPITYNLGQHIPLMNNLYVGPSMQVGTNGEVSLGAGFRVGM